MPTETVKRFIIRVALELANHDMVHATLIDTSADPIVITLVVDDEEATLFDRAAQSNQDSSSADHRRTYAELSPLYRQQFGDDGERESLHEYVLRRLGFASDGEFLASIPLDPPADVLQHLSLVMLSDTAATTPPV
jgi:hypothetical protein